MKRKYEVIPDSSELKGVLTTGNYICPKCDGNEVFVELVQTRSSDEPETHPHMQGMQARVARVLSATIEPRNP